MWWFKFLSQTFLFTFKSVTGGHSDVCCVFTPALYLSSYSVCQSVLFSSPAFCVIIYRLHVCVGYLPFEYFLFYLKFNGSCFLLMLVLSMVERLFASGHRSWVRSQIQMILFKRKSWIQVISAGAGTLEPHPGGWPGEKVLIAWISYVSITAGFSLASL